MKTRGFSLYDVEQFLREAGAERVTDDAILDLEKELEELTNKIGRSALNYARHAGRTKTIKKSDLVLMKHIASR